MTEKPDARTEVYESFIEQYLLATVGGRGSVVYMHTDADAEAVLPEIAKTQMVDKLLQALEVRDPVDQLKIYMIRILNSSSGEEKERLAKEAAQFAIKNGLDLDEHVVPIWEEFKTIVGIEEAGEVDEEQRIAWERLNEVTPPK
ncbi:hypothetical protein ACFLZH_04360 [Patescibacteria group bacterium]